MAATAATTIKVAATPVTPRRVLITWWPLAASWLLMGLELPAVSAVMARLANPEINLAAYGGVVFPLSLIIESPIIMLLAASTALSKDPASFALVRRFMVRTGLILTLIHAAVAFTPLYDLIVVGILKPPPEIIEPARIGLMLMLPWSPSIAYRRTMQGVLIRFGKSGAVGAGTIVRLVAEFSVLAIGYSTGMIPGIVVGTLAISAGVISEALYAGIVVQPVLRGPLQSAEVVDPPLTFRDFVSFYVPLALTSLVQLLFQPVGSAAMSRMPFALESLAAWPVFAGLSFLLRSQALAYNEVTVALLDEAGSVKSLRRVAGWMVTALTLLSALFSLTPLAGLWFEGISGLTPRLADYAAFSLAITLPAAGFSVLISWYQGALVHRRETGAVIESMVVALGGVLLTAVVGVWLNRFVGIYVAAAGFSLSFAAQAAWLWIRSRRVMRDLNERDAGLGAES